MTFFHKADSNKEDSMAYCSCIKVSVL